MKKIGDKYTNNIFDSIKHIDEYGNEYWYARELSKVLEYRDWRNFLKVLNKSKKACKNSGFNIDEQLVEVNKLSKRNNNAVANIQDYKLSRYICYLIVQNADPSKEVVALGQTYFAIQTRKQEIKEIFMEEYLEFAKDVAYQAGKIMLKYFNQNNGASYKGDRTIVTLADTEINSYLIERVKDKYPEHSVDGEEEQCGKSNFVWVCDPVDGTAMYARHIPVAVFSLSLVIDGVPYVGVVYDPFTDSLYSAVKEKGAYKNNEKISVNNYTLDDIRTVCHCDMWSKAGYNICNVFEKLREKTRLNDIGSITRASCCVATGDYSLTIFTGTKHKHCDIAAVKVIVEEAGGKVTDLFGNEQRYDKDIKGAVISNGIVHEEALKAIKDYIIEV